MGLRQLSRFTILSGKSGSPAISAIATRLPEIRRSAFHQSRPFDYPIGNVRFQAMPIARRMTITGAERT
jgi:hypothetical protein